MSVTNYRGKCIREKGEQCDNCGATESIEVHHIDGDRTNNALENLLPLCRHCHTKLHRSGLNDLENELLPVDERPHIDKGMTSFQISVPCDEWQAWKNTVPRSKSLETRINELIRADTEGRVDGTNISEVVDALDDAEAAAERGDGDALRAALDRAREALNDA